MIENPLSYKIFLTVFIQGDSCSIIILYQLEEVIVVTFKSNYT